MKNIRETNLNTNDYYLIEIVAVDTQDFFFPFVILD